MKNSKYTNENLNFIKTSAEWEWISPSLSTLSKEDAYFGTIPRLNPEHTAAFAYIINVSPIFTLNVGINISTNLITNKLDFFVISINN